tara:strand:- start:111 stop:704 length:594 start_codon:yes stop_codon:yes gene_type:complete
MGILSGIGKGAARGVARGAKKAKDVISKSKDTGTPMKLKNLPRSARNEFQDISGKPYKIGKKDPGVTYGGGSQRSAVIGKQRVKDYTSKRRLEGGAVGLGLGTVAGGATVYALSDDKDKKKTGGAKAASKPKEKAKAKPKKKASDSKSNGRVNPSDYPIYKKDTKSGAAFRKAFKEAVKAKKKTFKFEGRSYSTKKK